MTATRTKPILNAWSWRRITIAAGLAASLLLTSCSSNYYPDPDIVLGQDVVGGEVTPNAARLAYSANAAPCNLDGTSLLGGARENNVGGFERPSDGVKEFVLIGAWERPQGLWDSGMDRLKRGLKSELCHTPPKSVDTITWTRDHVEFRSIGRDREDERYSVLRSYTYVHPPQGSPGPPTLVLVSLERTGNTDPKLSDLRELTKKQVALTRRSFD